MDKAHKPVTLNAIHHHQNPLDSADLEMFCFRICFPLLPFVIISPVLELQKYEIPSAVIVYRFSMY
jgi:hypothetical protein